MSHIRLAGMLPHSLVNGPGIRFVLFLQGCEHRCPECHNPGTHDLFGGTEYTLEEVSQMIRSAKHIDGITISGGEPFLQPEACAKLSMEARETGLSVWCYTGWTLEELLCASNRHQALQVLQNIDVLVDGRFVAALQANHPKECLWRGSTNQRLIDARVSLQEGRPVLFQIYDDEFLR